MMNDYNSLSLGLITSLKRTFQKKVVLPLFFVLFGVLGVNAQVTTNGGSGLAGTYGSLASAITALNSATISSPVVITLTGNETAPVGGYNITATGTSTNTITIQGSSSTITAATGLTSGALNDAIFKITGGDYITIQSFTMQENASNTTTTAGSNNMTEFGVALFYASATNGAQNCTIQNNTISLNRTYQNTFGIYSNSTHTATTVATTASATGTGGGNSGLKIYGNGISNVNMGILVIGPTAAADANTGLDIGGASGSTSNTISNFGTTGTFSGYANVSGTVNGILIRNCNGFNISYNSITSSNGGVTAGTLNGIQVAASSNTPTGTFTNNITNNTFSLTSGTSSGAINGITYPSGSASTTSVLNVNNNNFTAAASTVTTSGTIVLISVGSANLTTSISNNTFTNIVSNTTGSFTFISHSFNIAAGGTQTVSGNAIVTGFSKTGAGGTVTCLTTGGSSPNSTTANVTNNNFSNITVTGATGITGASNSDGSGSSPAKIYTGNTFNNWTGGTSSITGITIGYIGATTSNVSNNTITNITGQSTLTGITIGSSFSGATTLNVSNNTVSNLTSTGTGGSVTGIASTNTSTTININGNAINTLATTAGSAVTGISVGGSTTYNVYQNKIYNLSGSSASSTVNGITISSGTNVNTYNNIIGDLRATIASGNDVIRGINITATTATSNQRVYYNTIYLNGTSSGANFGSSGIFHTYSATATTAALDMRNNIIVNASGANGTGRAVAFRRSSATDLNNYATTSNNNLFYGTSGVYTDGTNLDAFGAFQTRVSTRETASKSQNPAFASTTGSASTFLHFASGATNLAGGNGQVISGYTTDFEGDTRDGSTPDIGADEFVNGTITAPTITSFTPTTLCIQGGQTVTITGTGLDTVSTVLFNGTATPGTIVGTPTATSLTVITPAGVVDGTIEVTNPAGTGTSGSTFIAAVTPTVGVSSNVAICSGGNTSLTATGAATYSWSPSTGLSATTGDTVTASPAMTTTYTVTGVSAAGCTATATVTVTVNGTPSAITVSKNPTASCAGGITTLTANGGTVGASGSNTVGADTTLTTANGTEPTAFNNRYENYWMQMVFTPAELNAAGVLAGSISAVKFNITTLGDGTSVGDLRIRMGAAPSGTLTGFQTTGLTLVKSVATYSHVVGVNTITFDTPYVWDGTSNIIFDLRSRGADSTNNAITYYTATAGNTVATAVTTGTFTTPDDYVATNPSATLSTKRLNTTFTWSSSVPTTFAWTPTDDLYSNAGATTAYTNENQAVVYSKGTVSRTYTVTATNAGCTSTANVTVSPNALPTISTNGITICTGGSGGTLTATGGTSYTWSPATGLSATTGDSVTANPATTATYTVTGTDANGCQNTATATVTVNDHIVITSQPANQVVLENAPASFSVAATGTGVTYQWQVNDGSGFVDLSGETSATLSIASATASQNGYLYHCVVSGATPCAPVASDAALLTVGDVSIATQPQSQTICSDTSATFTVGTTGTVTSYQWQYSANGTSWSDISGETNASLVLTGLTSTNTGTYFRVVLNGSVNSNAATVTVYDVVAFTSQPTSQAVCAGVASVTFTAPATGSGIAYQWEMSTNGTTWSNVGTDSSTYVVSHPTAAMNGYQYRVTVTGTSPCNPLTSSVATLTVNDVTLAASPTAVCIGASFDLNATFVGAPDHTTATWTCATAGSGAETPLSGASVSVTPSVAGTFVYTFATNGTCPISKTISVTVNPLPTITTATASPAAVCSDGTINLEATSLGYSNSPVTLGAGATTSTSAGANPFYGGYGGVKTQFIIKASELTALGLVAGNITSLGLDLTTAGSTLSGFALNVEHTSLSALTSTIETVSNTVYSGSFVPSVGINTINFSTPFAWNGTSNIILSFCWSNNNTSNTASTVKVDAAGFTSSNARYVDSKTSSDVCSYTGSTTPSGWNGAATTGSNRPKFVVTGNKVSNVASTYTWSWNSTPAVTAATGTTSETNTSGVDVVKTYTATATSAGGCVSTATTNAVTVHSTIPAPTGTDSTQCGTNTPTCSVTGTGISGNAFRWYTVSTNGTAIAGQSGSTLVAPYTIAATTTFYVAEVSADGLCEGPRTAVTATVTSPYAFTLSTGTMTNCSGSASTTPVTIATNGGYTAYSWSNNGTVSGNETTGWYFSPTTTTTYTVTATGGGCSTTASVVVTPVALPIVNVAAVPSSICVGATSTLTATTNVVGAGNVAVGSGASTSASSGASMFPGTYGGAKTQYIIKASELTAAGLFAGNITSLSFEATTAFNGYEGFALNIGHTAVSTAAMPMITTGLTQVYSGTGTNGAYATTVGVNTLTFSTPFSWNGTSNIVLSFCWAKNPTATSTTSTTVKTDSPGFTCTVYGLKDSTIAATMCPFSASVDFGTSGTGTSRPKFTFAGQTTIQGTGGLSYTWNGSSNTSNVLTATPSTTTTYTAYGLNGTTGCTGTGSATVTVYDIPSAPTATNGARCNAGVVSAATVADTNGFTTPTFKWYADNVTTTALQASTSTSYTTTVSATTTLYVAVVSPGGCESARTPITLTINTPATLTVSPAATVCTGGNTTLTASGAVSYTWSPALGLNGTTSASVIATPSATTTYSVTGVDANGCTTAAATVTVTVATYPSSVSITQGASSVCTDSVMSLTASGGTVAGAGNAAIGTQSTTEFGGGVYRNGYGTGDFRHQLIYTAAELTAAGITAGNLTSLTFNVTSVGSGSANNYTISLGNASAATATATFDTASLTQVYSAATYTAVTGDNVHTFTTPYSWNGTSDLLVNICYNISSIGGSSTLAATTPSTLRNVNLLGSTGACTAAAGGTTYANRPLAKFGYTTVNNTPITWSPMTNLYTDAAATTPYTGGAATVVYTKPAGDITYTATATNAGTCSTSASTTVTPIPLPVFTLEDVTICGGQSTTLTATGAGNSYTWSPSTGLDTTSGASVTANPTTTTTYTVVGTSISTNCVNTHTVTVTVNQPVIITGVTPTSNSVRATQSATYTVDATGTGLTYQWQVDAGSGFVNITDDAMYSGATTATLSIVDIITDMNGYQYQCVVSGTTPCTSATSESAILNVDATGIDTQPVSTTVCAGNSAQFNVVASSEDPEQDPFIIYNWEYKIGTGTFQQIVDGYDAVSGLTFSGSETATLTMTGTTFANNDMEFHAIVNGYIFSSDATLTVKHPVVIGTQPADQTVCASAGTATFSVAATGDNLGYQWQFSTNGGTTWADYAGSGATSTSITISNPAAAADGTQYRVVVSGAASCGSLTSSVATLHVTNPMITSQPAAATLLRGATATFTVAANAATSYQWQYSTTLNGTYTNVADETPVGTAYIGAASATLSVFTTESTPTGNGYFYRCVVTYNGCTATSAGAQLTVNGYCTPVAATSTASYFDSFTTTGGGDNITNSGSGFSTDGYGNFTSQSVSQIVGNTVNYNTTLVGTTVGVAIWVDWNQNGTFETTERVANTTGYVSTFTGSFAVPVTATLGSTRMRILMDFNNSNPANPCGPFGSGRGEVEDYTFIVNPQPVCTTGNYVAGTAAAASASLCAGGSGTTISLTGVTTGVAGLTYQWYYSSNGTTYAPVSGATTTSLSTGSLSANAYYYCTTSCSAGGSLDSNIVAITVSDPQLTGTTAGSRCGTGTVTLGATANAGASVNWYAAATGGSALGTGDSFTTPSITATTTYYAEAGTGTSSNMGRLTHVAGSGTNLTTYGQDFTITQPITLNSVNVISTTGTSITISLYNSTGATQLLTKGATTVVAGSTQTINLGWSIAPGTYRLVANGMTGNFIRENSDVTYPIALSGIGQINGFVSSITGTVTTSSSYYFMYNWNIKTGCASSRTAVVATVTPLPTATISYASPFCSTDGIKSVTLNGTNAYTGGTFSSTAGLAIDPSTGAIDVAGSTPGTYTVTYTTNPIADCTAQTATTSVTINQAISSGFEYGSSSFCTTGGTISPILAGAAGTFTSTPAGLSINSSTGVITLATSAAGAYTVTNTVVVAGCTNSISSQLVNVSTAVAITSQPVSVSKLPTENTSFSVAGTGTGVTYQWQVNDGSGWVSLSDDATYSGSTSATLSLTAVTTGMNGYLYQAVVSGTGGCASVTSTSATLTVSTAAIATHPANFTACSAGANTASFTIATTGDATTFQWQVSTNGTTWTNVTNGGNYANADTTSLSLSGLSLSDNGLQFRCVVNGVVNSNAATLTVKEAVAVTTQPANTTACSAGSATFTVAASGASPSYQWEVSTNGTTWANVSGATSTTLVLTGITVGMNGYQYRAVVSGAAPCSPTTSNVATLTVNTAVAITTQPANVSICPSANASFSVAATGTGLGYQWQMSTNGTTWSDISGETASTLSITGATFAMNGYQYRAVVSGAAPCGSVTSSAATLTIALPAAPIISPASADLCPNAIQALSVSNPSVGSTASILTLGAGTSLSTASTTAATLGPNPMQSYYGGARQQMLITAAELTALGISNGSVINSVAFNLSAVEARTLQNYTVKLKNTATTAFSSTTFETGATTVRNAANYTPVVGWNTLAFNSNFTYTGQSLLVEVTFSNADGGGTGTNRAYYSTTSFASTLFYRVDSSAAATVAAATTASFSAYTQRNNMQFGVLAPTTTWSPTTGLYTNAAATTPYTGGGASTVYVKTATSATYTVTNNNSLGCTNTSTVAVTISTPSTLSSITQPATTCSGSQTTFALTGLLPNSTSTISYTINGSAGTPVTGVVADASGNGSFALTLPAFNNGQTLAITAIQRTGVTPSCTTAISANNTVVISVQPLVTYYADADGDGYGNNAVTQITCTGQPVGYVTNNTDCDDTDITKHATFNFYVDGDGDGYGAGSAVALCTVNGTTAPAGYSVNNTDCNDADATKHASFSFYVDADGDGYGTGSLVSGVCAVNSTTAPAGYSVNNTDCNDDNSSIHAHVTNTSNVTACGSYTWSVNGATYTTNGTYTYVVDSCHTEVLNLTISCSSVVNVKMFIQGYYAGSGAMTTVKANQGVGSSTTDVDDVTIELRDASTYALVTSTTASLQTDGTAVATFGTAPSGNFYIAVKHRNIVQTWSAAPVAVGSSPASYDFTTAANKAYGDNMVDLGSGVFGFYSGDLTQDEFVDFSDYTIWETDYNDSAIGYYATDLNGDGFVDFSDYTIWETNYNSSVFSSHP